MGRVKDRYTDAMDGVTPEQAPGDPDRALKDALFANLKAGRRKASYGGVIVDDDGSRAWVRFDITDPKESAKRIEALSEDS